jgi:hypothetical protein
MNIHIHLFMQVVAEAGRTWARWERWRREKPQKADEWRRQHQDETGSDWGWMLRFAKPASTAARRAVELALRAYAVQRKTADRPPETACAACGGARYWRKRSGDWARAICHPPPTPTDAVEWIGSARESNVDIAALPCKKTAHFWGNLVSAIFNMNMI